VNHTAESIDGERPCRFNIGPDPASSGQSKKAFERPLLRGFEQYVTREVRTTVRMAPFAGRENTLT
jgi:hypothetical protein